MQIHVFEFLLAFQIGFSRSVPSGTKDITLTTKKFSAGIPFFMSLGCQKVLILLEVKTQFAQKYITQSARQGLSRQLFT